MLDMDSNWIVWHSSALLCDPCRVNILRQVELQAAVQAEDGDLLTAEEVSSLQAVNRNEHTLAGTVSLERLATCLQETAGLVTNRCRRSATPADDTNMAGTRRDA